MLSLISLSSSLLYSIPSPLKSLGRRSSIHPKFLFSFNDLAALQVIGGSFRDNTLSRPLALVLMHCRMIKHHGLVTWLTWTQGALGVDENTGVGSVGLYSRLFFRFSCSSIAGRCINQLMDTCSSGLRGCDNPSHERRTANFLQVKSNGTARSVCLVYLYRCTCIGAHF